MFHGDPIVFDGGAAPLDETPLAWSPGSELPAMLSRFFAERSTEPDWKWAEDNIVLDSKQSPGNPGPYRVAKAPHTRFLQERSRDPAVRQFTIKKNSQGGWTEAILNVIRSRVARQPCNVLYVIDSITEARRIATIRLKSSLERCEATAQAISEDPGDNTTLTLIMRDMFIMFAGGGSIGAVANKPIELGVVDEADKIPRITGGQGHVVNEMKARFKTVPDGLLFVLSAPNEEQDITTTEYKNGSQHKYFVPCPHCDHFQEMVQERLRFDHCKDLVGDYDKEKVLREAYYQCERAGTAACPDGKIYDHHKPRMSDRGEWRQTNPNPEPGHISMESSDLFSLFPDASLGRIALDLIDSFKNPVKKRSVQRDRFGKEYKTRRAEVKQEDLLVLRGVYKRGTVPLPCVAFGLASDVQGDARKWIKGGFARNGDLFVTDYGASLAFDDLTIEADRPVHELVTNRTHLVSSGLIDEGYKTDEVRKFCIASGFRFLPAKGRSGVQNRGALVHESLTKHDGAEFYAYHFNDDQFKQDLYISRIKEFDRIKKGLAKIPRIWLPSDVDAEFLGELMAEQLVPEVTAWGYTRFVWEKTGTNDYGDALKLLLVWWHAIGPAILADLPPEDAPVPAAA